ncbi:hypothetical protein [Aureibaculum flavum]|nr:hypothetical protein [Aureibaculum flavum]
MKFKRLRPRRQPNQKRAMLLIVLLLLVILIWLNADSLMARVFNK